MVSVCTARIRGEIVSRCGCVRYGWRYQIGPWVRAGYRVVVPDMLGYGGTDKPLAVEEYSTKKLCADLAALLDIIGVSRAVSSRSRSLQDRVSTLS
jgi:hypothetical protein